MRPGSSHPLHHPCRCRPKSDPPHHPRCLLRHRPLPLNNRRLSPRMCAPMVYSTPIPPTLPPSLYPTPPQRAAGRCCGWYERRSRGLRHRASCRRLGGIIRGQQRRGARRRPNSSTVIAISVSIKGKNFTGSHYIDFTDIKLLCIIASGAGGR